MLEKEHAYSAYREEHLFAYNACRKEHAYNTYREEHLAAYSACRKQHAYNAYREEHLSAYLHIPVSSKHIIIDVVECSEHVCREQNTAR